MSRRDADHRRPSSGNWSTVPPLRHTNTLRRTNVLVDAIPCHDTVVLFRSHPANLVPLCVRVINIPHAHTHSHTTLATPVTINGYLSPHKAKYATYPDNTKTLPLRISDKMPKAHAYIISCRSQITCMHCPT